jgi:hypothetical protein
MNGRSLAVRSSIDDKRTWSEMEDMMVPRSSVSSGASSAGRNGAYAAAKTPVQIDLFVVSDSRLPRSVTIQSPLTSTLVHIYTYIRTGARAVDLMQGDARVLQRLKGNVQRRQLVRVRVLGQLGRDVEERGVPGDEVLEREGRGPARVQLQGEKKGGGGGC